MFKTTRRVGIAILMGAVLAACGGPPPPKPPDPTVAQVTLAATDDANPDPTGRASPTVVFVYALKPGAQFSTGSYDALTGGELGDLGATMTRIARIVLVPGKDTKKIFEVPNDTAEIGVAAAFRDISTAAWRASAPIKANEVTLLKATIGSNTVTVE